MYENEQNKEDNFPILRIIKTFQEDGIDDIIKFEKEFFNKFWNDPHK